MTNVGGRGSDDSSTTDAQARRAVYLAPFIASYQNPMSHYHFVVWIDHREAHVIQFNPDDAEASVIHPKSKHEHLHHKHGVIGSGKAPEDHVYYQGVAAAIKDAGEILIVGPSTAKLEFFKHLQAHDPAIAARVVSVESVDHPTDGELLKYARRHFAADDRMRSQT
jgi:hypothetical protein